MMELMSNNFRAQGYSMTRIESSGECRVVIPYKIIESTIFAIVLVDLEIGTELGIREYQGMLRTFQQSVFNEYVTELKILQVIVTNSMDVARDLPSPIWPYWIIHLEECRLMVYEAEHPFFSEARIIIEDTLRGKDYRKKKVDFPLITMGLIVINILIFVILEILGSTYDVDFMLKHGADRYQETIQQKEYYRLITSCFLHYGYEHLISNMFSLMVIGYYLENAIKKGRYLFVYLLCGVTSSIFSLYW